MMAEPVYVEVLIQATLDDLWYRTQDPACHERWDARFTRITYVSSIDPGRNSSGTGPTGATRFRYATRVLPGLTIRGYGVTVRESRRDDGTRTSALRFYSPDRLSPIRHGSGYWRYMPTANGIRFLTGYQYSPGWAQLGQFADLAFRPLLGWATAWSFDRLRLWLERGITPRRAVVHACGELVARFAVIAVSAALGGAAVVPAGLLALVLPPTPWTPAARRCTRKPLNKAAGRPSAIATSLEEA